MAWSSAARAVPLRYRVPRPPRLFVGRDDELRALDALAARGAVSWVWGEAGFGKSALVFRWLSTRAGEDVGEALWFGLRPDRHVDTHELELGQIMASLRGVGFSDWRGGRDPTALHETLFELAEASAHVVVLDDAHHHIDRVEQLAQLAAAHATRSRWIVVARTPPSSPSLAPAAMQIAALPDARLHELALAAAPAAEPIGGVVRAARGSPLRLLASLGSSGARSGVPWDALPPPLADVTQLVAAVPRPCSVDMLERIAARAVRPDLDVLDTRGLVELREGLVVLHESARASMSASAKAAALTRWGPALARELEASSDHGDLMDAVRIHLHLGRHEDVARLLGETFDRLVSGGLAGEVFTALPAAEPRLRSLRMRFAVHAGTGEALAWVRDEPPPREPLARLAWASAAAVAGKASEARAVARELRETSTGALQLDATLIEALANRLLGELDAAIALTATPRSDPTEEARRLVERAQALGTRGDGDEARRALAGAEALLDALAPAARAEVLGGISTAYFRLGRLREAASAGRRQRSAALLMPDQSGLELAVAAVFAIESADVDAGAAFTGRLRRCAADSEILRAIASLAELRLALARGDEHAEERIAPLLLDTRDNEALDELAAWAVGAAAYGAIVLGLDDVDGASEAATASLDLDVTVATPLARMLARRRGRPAADTPQAAASSRQVELLRLRELVEERMLAGDHDGAKRHLARLVWLAERHGWTLHELDALLLRADLAIVEAGPGEAMPRVARVIAALHGRVAGTRYEDEVRFLEAIVEPDGPSDARLVEARAARSPIVARRARALLGEEPPIADRLDALVVAALRARRDTHVGRGAPQAGPPMDAPRPPSGSARAAWAFDPQARQATLPGGRTVALQRHAILARILEALLAANDLELSKEDLVARVWGVRDYHPLRDDKRLHVAAHRLRVAIEDDPEHPQRLVTTADGYALRQLRPGGSCRTP